MAGERDRLPELHLPHQLGKMVLGSRDGNSGYVQRSTWSKVEE
jgi:hypothetical protein